METLLIEFVNTLDASLKNMVKKWGESRDFSRLTINQFHYLDAIHELGNPTITEIANRLNITKASVTAGINKLIQLGFLNKTQSITDRRVYHVTLSGTGERLIEAKFSAVEAYSAFIRSALNDEETIQFQVILTKLVRLFKQA